MADNDKNSIGIIGLLIFGLFLAYLAWLLSRHHTTTVKEVEGGWVIAET